MANLKSLIVSGGNCTVTSSGDVTAKSFIKKGYNDNHILLGGGGTKLISSFAVQNHTHYSLETEGDNRSTNTTPNDYVNCLAFRGLKSTNALGFSGPGNYAYLLGLRGWADQSGGGSFELAFSSSYTGIYYRYQESSSNTWNEWKKLCTIDHTHNLAVASTKTAFGLTGGSNGFLSANDKAFIDAVKTYKVMTGFKSGYNPSTATQAKLTCLHYNIADNYDSLVEVFDPAITGDLPMASDSSAGCITSEQYSNIIKLSGKKYNNGVDTVDSYDGYYSADLSFSDVNAPEKITCLYDDVNIVIFYLYNVVYDNTAYYISYNSYDTSRLRLELKTTGHFKITVG